MVFVLFVKGIFHLSKVKPLSYAAKPDWNFSSLNFSEPHHSGIEIHTTDSKLHPDNFSQNRTIVELCSLPH